MRRLVSFAAAAVVVAAVVWLLARDDVPTASSRPVDKTESPSPAPAPAPSTKPSDPRFELARRRIDERKRNRPRADATRQSLREAIPPREVDPPNPSPTAARKLFDEDSIEDREFLRRVIEEQIIPVVKDCYALELEDRPGLTGKITVEPTIVADEEIGAVVEDAKILDDDTTIDAEDLKECVVETTLALEFSPPDEGRGRQPIAFTIAFSGDLEDE